MGNRFGAMPQAARATHAAPRAVFHRLGLSVGIAIALAGCGKAEHHETVYAAGDFGFDDRCYGDSSVSQYTEVRNIARDYPALRHFIRESLRSGGHIDPCESEDIESRRDRSDIAAVKREIGAETTR